MLAMELGYAPTTSKCLYEVEWMFGVFVDIYEKPERPAALLNSNASAEVRQSCVSLLCNLIGKLDNHWADGRAHVGGDQVTYADFWILSIVLSHYENPNGRHPDIREAVVAKL